MSDSDVSAASNTPCDGLLAPFGADVANLLVHFAQNLATALLENPLQLRITVTGHLSARCLFNLGMNAHMNSAPFPLTCLLVMLQALYANDLPV